MSIVYSSLYSFSVEFLNHVNEFRAQNNLVRATIISKLCRVLPWKGNFFQKKIFIQNLLAIKDNLNLTQTAQIQLQLQEAMLYSSSRENLQVDENFHFGT